MLASPKDTTASIVLIGVFALMSIVGTPRSVMNALIARPLAVSVVWMGFIAFLLFQKYYMTGILFALLGLYVSFNVNSSYIFSSEGILAEYKALQEKDPRFSHTDSLDIQVADETLQVDPSRWLDPGRPPLPLLLFPPTPEQLRLAGSG